MRDPVLSDFLKDRGNATRLAEACGITPAAVYQWNRVPATKVITVERFTGIPRHILRADVFPAPTQQVA